MTNKPLKVGLKAYLFFIIPAVILGASCGKTQVDLDPKNLPVYEVPNKESGIPSDQVSSDAQIVELGTGSGDLLIDGGSVKSIDKNVFIKIKAGTYKTITIKNLLATAGKRIFIKNNGQVKVSQAMYTENINNVTISGDNVPGLKYGFIFENITYRAIMMSGKMNGVTLRNLSFKNVSNYVIAGERNNGRDFQYKGTVETRTENFKILNCSFDNAAQITFGGIIDKGSNEDTGFFKEVEIAYNNFSNNPTAGSLCSFSNVQNFNIHNNVVQNVNQQNNNHNSIFYMQGNGTFNSNKLLNYQGNALRLWSYSRGNTPSTNLIYNNKCFNSRKYSAFELQAFERNLIPGKTTYANAKVYNNTVGQMNTSKDWEGQILDFYHTGGTLEYYNNLGFKLVSGRAISNMINNMSDSKIIKQTNNKYVVSAVSAVNNVQDLNSLFSGIGSAKF